MGKASTNFGIWFLVFLALGSLASSQYLYDAGADGYTHQLKAAILHNDHPLIPSLPILRALSLGNTSMTADILWLQTIQYYGGGDIYGKYESLGSLLDTITQLDPKFNYAYQFALIVLPYMGQADMAVKIGLRAQQEGLNDGLITYYLASVYHLNLKEYKQAAKYYQLASTQSGSPTAAKTLAATALDNVSGSLADRLVAADYWKTVFDNATDPDQKKLAASWYQQMQNVYSIEKASQDFHAKQGRFPNSQEELVQYGLLPAELGSPVGRVITLDPKSGKVDFSQRAQ
ncbi:MAG: hypothetical protein WCO52_03345 [bacterium]